MPGVYPAASGGATNPPRKLLDQVRDALRVKHYSYRTEQAYVGWIRRFILFHDKRHPMEMGGPEVERFLTWLATDRTVAASTQTQALSALLFLYKHVLRIELPLLTKFLGPPTATDHAPPPTGDPSAARPAVGS